jgi:hypothetical protein
VNLADLTPEQRAHAAAAVESIPRTVFDRAIELYGQIARAFEVARDASTSEQRLEAIANAVTTLEELRRLLGWGPS